MKNLIYMMMLLSTLISCEDKSTGNDKAATFEVNTQSTSKLLMGLSLEDKLKMKYSSLKLKCTMNTQLQTGDTIVVENKKEVMLWDLLSDYQTSKLIRYSDDTDDYFERLYIDLKPRFIESMNIVSEDSERRTEYRLKNVISLGIDGSLEYLFNPKHADFAALNLSSAKVGTIEDFIIDMKSTDLEIEADTSFDSTGKKMSFKVDCYLDSEVKEKFKDDSQIIIKLK